MLKGDTLEGLQTFHSWDLMTKQQIKLQKTAN